MRSTVAKALVIAAAMAASGCATTYVPVELPELDERALRPCFRGDAKLGDDVIIAGRRKENARACEAGRRAALADFYGDLRRRLGEVR